MQLTPCLPLAPKQRNCMLVASKAPLNALQGAVTGCNLASLSGYTVAAYNPAALVFFAMAVAIALAMGHNTGADEFWCAGGCSPAFAPVGCNLKGHRAYETRQTD